MAGVYLAMFVARQQNRVGHAAVTKVHHTPLAAVKALKLLLPTL